MARPFSTSRKRPDPNSGSGSDSSLKDETDSDAPASRVAASSRVITVNLPLPEHHLNEKGLPSALYARNKIRTSRYTPLNFVPKNLFYQFHNIANIYFVIIVILGFFSIFGVTNPGLSVVPIVAILTITAIKDAIEDYRRTLLDLEVNNAPTQRLSHWHNYNVSEESISLWRRFKKACTRTAVPLWNAIKNPIMRLFVKNYNPDSLHRTFSLRTIHSTTSEHPNGTRFDLSRTRSKAERKSYVNEFRASADSRSSPRSSADYSASRRYLSKSGGHVDSDTGPATSVIDPYATAPGTARFKYDYWKNVKVGDIVRVSCDNEIPADIAVLSTSDEDGACYVETKNLDGETNLKVRQSLRATRAIKHASDCERARFWIKSEGPNPHLYSYSGALFWENITHDAQGNVNGREELSEPISMNNMLLRGSSLRNTEWVIGVVIFAGMETKVMLSAGITPSKRSKIQRDLNSYVIYNFGILFALCFIQGLINGIFIAKEGTSGDYFDFGVTGGGPAGAGAITFIVAVILFQSLVPISLYISIEIVKTIQAFFIYSDCLMYYDAIDYPCTPKSWNISDDLGQIEYIFSDKTGTLTQNKMEFKKCTINGVTYGLAYTEALAGLEKRRGIDVEAQGKRMAEIIAKDKIEMTSELQKLYKNPQFREDRLTFISSDFARDLSGANGEAQAKANHHFMLSLAICHSVLTSDKYPADGAEDIEPLDYKAQSPDEEALVSTARDLGFALIERTQKGVIIDLLGQRIEFPILAILEFNSTRKRMSVIVRMPDTGKILLICKGADSVIKGRLSEEQVIDITEKTYEDLENYATEGLRTLCIAEREISQSEYNSWSKIHKEAATSIENRDDKLEEAANMIETNLTLIGGTAIEDRLQDGVPDTIAKLEEAGIKVWVLTGDKVETAINIGYSCNLISTDMEVLVLQMEGKDLTTEHVREVIDEYLLQSFGLEYSEALFRKAKSDHSSPSPTHALVIDGDTLKCALHDDVIHRFLVLGKQCASVLCCRVSPAQKASVVKAVRKNFQVMTLSIGDGANDVAMIQTADVGIGIAGVEGRQAVMSADYAIGQFRFLQRLVLVHGRWCYHRIAEMLPNFFYKNLFFTITSFWYQIFNQFDGSYLYDYTYLTLVNLAFTSLPVIILGILDQDVPDAVALAEPRLYRRGILGLDWTPLRFWIYMIDGLYQSAVCFFFMYGLFQGSLGIVTQSGYAIDTAYFLGVYVATGAIIACDVYVLLNQYRWDGITLGLQAFSILILFFWTGVYSTSTYSAMFYGAAPRVYGALSFWALIFIAIAACLCPSFFFKSVATVFFPKDVDIIRERVKLGYYDDVLQAEELEREKGQKPMSGKQKESVMDKLTMKKWRDEHSRRKTVSAADQDHDGHELEPRASEVLSAIERSAYKRTKPLSQRMKFPTRKNQSSENDKNLHSVDEE
ncbi:hypothetical protein CANCADRAFT_26222 [Tortispora caseinolytica NRRL Y-17796]|uniref:Phospholipid-transporting ATPase n=1 Tax=Tortispora caseinolytica NRRL Y-17796 TaxID=767744 RepID=A0A1E4TDZ8_9ASCO|nr:hypothetical protein CANCADRAFT_26222 [Tortispora caseinolytica NRRL Y-17796]